MGSILKMLFLILLGLIILVIAIPLLWLVIKEITGLFGDSLASLGNVSDNIGYIIFTVLCVCFIIWALAN